MGGGLAVTGGAGNAGVGVVLPAPGTAPRGVDERAARDVPLGRSGVGAAKHAGLAGERRRDVCDRLGDSVCRSSL
ncbi:hypothetical protein D3C84_939120 [compost metagenome]